MNKKAKTFTEFPDKHALIPKLEEIALAGKNPCDYGIVANKQPAFNVAYSVSILERAPGRKTLDGVRKNHFDCSGIHP